MGSDEYKLKFDNSKDVKTPVLVNQAGAALGIKLRDWREALADYVQTEFNEWNGQRNE